MKQTALDFFNDSLDDILELYPSEWIEIQEVFNKAKEMEKEQVIESFLKCIEVMDSDPYTTIMEKAEEYYNETYKNTNE